MMDNVERAEDFRQKGRSIEIAQPRDALLGPLKLLPGTWQNANPQIPQGWNMIALPFGTEPASPFNYRLLMNHYNEKLEFTTVDKAVPNRGVDRVMSPSVSLDQFIVTLNYIQTINQVRAADEPNSGKAGNDGLAIHHEPGLFLNMTNHVTKSVDIARMGTIPHGNALLAMGHFDDSVDIFNGPPTIPAISGLPVGVGTPPNLQGNPYLAPYKHFDTNPFFGTVPPGTPGFPGFNPVKPAELLTLGMPQNVLRTTRLAMTTNLQDGGISNIPFIVREADASLMESTFWIMELDEPGFDGEPKLVMQYLQVVMLDFFPRRDGTAGAIAWPHVSINTMEKVANPGDTMEMTTVPAV
ncbi:heme-binding protein [Thetidibacter halocola]|uniref:Uncharacterized protein n=1 Tax=Thetidibacter halocola TaxID=2827239 RepID=A0A8J8BB59_9RHOB|nr:heme-binding protein [Thetidibacter halocola]MBS0125898.1 hypothetical protein [Thetidibacter halocola]